METIIELVQTLLEAYDRGDYKSLSSMSDNVYLGFKNIEHGTLYSTVIVNNPKIESIDWANTNKSRLFRNFSMDEYRDSVYMRPWRLDSFGASEEEQILKMKIVNDTIQINGFGNFWNNIAKVIAMFPKSQDCIILQKYKSYLKLFDCEPFYELPDGKVKIHEKCFDLMVTYRSMLTMRCIWEIYSRDFRDVDAIIEIHDFLFFDPQYNSSELKTMKTPFVLSAASIPNSGFMLKWNQGLRDFDLKPIVRNQSIEIRMLYSEKVAEASKKLRENNLPKTLNWLSSLINGKCDGDNMLASLSFLVFVEALVGYIRMDTGNIFRIAQEKIKNVKIEGAKVPEYLEEKFFQFFLRVRIPATIEEYSEQMITSLTTRSAGLNADYGSEVTVNLHGRDEKIKFKDKLGTFLSDPDRFSPGNFEDYLTEENPARVGWRSVPARRLGRYI